MIVIPKLLESEFTKEFRDLVTFFNKLESDLQYPQSEGVADRVRYLKQAQQELIKLGKI